MAMDRQIAEAGILRPSEVALLARVFQSTTVDNETETEREQRASRIIANFQAGITDEQELIELSRRPLGR